MSGNLSPKIIYLIASALPFTMRDDAMWNICAALPTHTRVSARCVYAMEIELITYYMHMLLAL